MKDYRVWFTAFVLGLAILMIGVFTISVFNYIAFLKEQNYSLLGIINYSISQLRKSVMNLESANTSRQLVVLKLENLALKKETERLEEELGHLRERIDAVKPQGAVRPSASEGTAQETTLEVKVRKESSEQQSARGNRGYITKSQ